MSHFAVMIIGNDIEKQMAPYQENNMGNCPEEYLSFFDTEDEMLEAYNNETDKHVQLESGEVIDKYDERFKVCEDEFSYRYVYPETSVMIDVPIKEIYKTFEDYAYEFEGYKERDPKTNRYGYWENEQAKWDWYQIGGRWTGYFRLKRIALLSEEKINFDELGYSTAEFMNFVELFMDDIDKFNDISDKLGAKTKELLQNNIIDFIKRILPEHMIGEPGLFTEYAKLGYADQAMKKDIDFMFMRNTAGEIATKDWDEVHSIIGNAFETFIPWNRWNIDNTKEEHQEIRNRYNAQEAVRMFRSIKNRGLLESVDKYNVPRSIFIQNAEDSSITPFALIKDGIWYEKGEMGWWGIASNEKGQSEWNREFNKLFDSLPDDTLLTVVDCHI